MIISLLWGKKQRFDREAGLCFFYLSPFDYNL